MGRPQKLPPFLIPEFEEENIDSNNILEKNKSPILSEVNELKTLKRFQKKSKMFTPRCDLC